MKIEKEKSMFKLNGHIIILYHETKASPTLSKTVSTATKILLTNEFTNLVLIFSL